MSRKPWFAKKIPESIERYILQFCIDKRLSWDKVIQQFFKGGFHSLNLNGRRYIKSQENYCRKAWYIARPELRKDRKFKFEMSWNIISCGALVNTIGNTGRTIQHWSGKRPVTKWLKNVQKFETSQPVIALQYLTEPRKFGVKGVSKFYVEKRIKNRIKTLRKIENKKAKLFWRQRKSIKLNEQLSKYGFVEDQIVLLSFSSLLWKGLKFFKGTCQFDLYNGDRMLSPHGNNRFNSKMVDKCHNTFKIRVNFCDGETRVYTPERFLSRIRNSKNEFQQQTKLNQRFIGANQRATNDIIQYFTHNLGQTQPLYIDANTFTINIDEQTYFTVTVGKVENILFNESGDLIGVLDNGVIQRRINH
jgi:hypothetical protein